MKTRGITLVFLVVLLACAFAAQAQTIISVSSDPGVPEPDARWAIKISVTCNNDVAVGAPITVDGDINYSGITDSRGLIWIYVYPVPHAPRIQFKVHLGSTVKDVEMPIALGTWEEEENLNGSFAGSYSISADKEVWPTVSCVASCASVAFSTSGKGKGSIPGATVITNSIDLILGVCASYITSSASSLVTGGVGLTQIKTFRFVPTHAGGAVPSKSILHRSVLQLHGEVGSFVVGGKVGNRGSSSASMTVAGAFSPPIVLKASDGDNGAGATPPVDKYINLPDSIASGGAISVPMSRAGSGQCIFHAPGVSGDGQSTVSNIKLSITEMVTRALYSVKLPSKAGG